MATPGNGVLLDTSVVVRHFRDASALAGKLDDYEELYLPQTALAELYAGAYRSAQSEKNLQQIARFLEAVDVLLADEFTPEFTDASPLNSLAREPRSRRTTSGLPPSQCKPICHWRPLTAISATSRA